MFSFLFVHFLVNIDISPAITVAVKHNISHILITHSNQIIIKTLATTLKCRYASDGNPLIQKYYSFS